MVTVYLRATSRQKHPKVRGKGHPFKAAPPASKHYDTIGDDPASGMTMPGVSEQGCRNKSRQKQPHTLQKMKAN